MSFGNIDKEITRRIRLSWAVIGKLNNVLDPQVNIPQHLKAKVYNPYGCETWPLTKRTIQLIAVSQIRMERNMMCILFQDKVSNINLRNASKIQDAVTRIQYLKFQWAGHVARANNWSNLVNSWIPRADIRLRGRPAERWDDDMRRCFGLAWRRLTTDRKSWNSRRGLRSGVDGFLGTNDEN